MELVTLTCCEAAKKYPSVYLTLKDTSVDSDSDQSEAEWVTALPDRWVAEAATGVEWFANHPPAKFCPYCATPVPEMVRVPREKLKKKTCRITDGGYYCDTCRKRLQDCKCARPETAFVPLTGKPGVP